MLALARQTNRKRCIDIGYYSNRGVDNGSSGYVRASVMETNGDSTGEILINCLTQFHDYMIGY